MKRTTIAIAALLLLAGLAAVTASAHEIRPLDWTKLEGGAGNDELAALCANQNLTCPWRNQTTFGTFS